MIKFIIIGGGDKKYAMANLVYLLAVVAILGVSFFLLLRSADKKLEGIKAKSKKKK